MPDRLPFELQRDGLQVRVFPDRPARHTCDLAGPGRVEKLDPSVVDPGVECRRSSPPSARGWHPDATLFIDAVAAVGIATS